MLSRLPPTTKALLIANSIVFVLQQPWLLGFAMIKTFALWPLSMNAFASEGLPHFMPWQLVSYVFLHAGLSHLFFNLLSLWMFGCALEQTWGQKRFLIFYLVCVIGAALCQLIVMHVTGVGLPVLGASGGVFGLLLAYGLLFPKQPIFLIFPPIRMTAKTFVMVYGAIELVLGVTGEQSGVAHFAHLGGALFGWLMIRYWRGQPPFGRNRSGQGKRFLF